MHPESTLEQGARATLEDWLSDTCSTVYAIEEWADQSRLALLFRPLQKRGWELSLIWVLPQGVRPDLAQFNARMREHLQDLSPPASRRLLVLQQAGVAQPSVRSLGEDSGLPGLQIVDQFDWNVTIERLQNALDTQKKWPFPAKKLLATKTYAAILLAVFLFQTFYEWQFGSLIPEYGVSLSNFSSDHPIRILSGTFLHGGVLHFGFNIISLFFLGGFLERLIGPLRLAVVLVVSGWTGAVCSVLMHEPSVVSVGASGAVYGLMGCLMVRLKTVDSRYGKFVVFQCCELMKNLGTLLLISTALPLLVPRVDLWGHLGGFIAGLFTGVLFTPTLRFSKVLVFGLFSLLFVGLHLQTSQKAQAYHATLQTLRADQKGYLKFANEKLAPILTRLEMLLARPSHSTSSKPLPQALKEPWMPRDAKRRKSLQRYIQVLKDGWSLLELPPQKRAEAFDRFQKKFQKLDQTMMQEFGVRREEQP